MHNTSWLRSTLSITCSGVKSSTPHILHSWPSQTQCIMRSWLRFKHNNTHESNWLNTLMVEAKNSIHTTHVAGTHTPRENLTNAELHIATYHTVHGGGPPARRITKPNLHNVSDQAKCEFICGAKLSATHKTPGRRQRAFSRAQDMGTRWRGGGGWHGHHHGTKKNEHNHGKEEIGLPPLRGGATQIWAEEIGSPLTPQHAKACLWNVWN
jgi:hypothetical protein